MPDPRSRSYVTATALLPSRRQVSVQLAWSAHPGPVALLCSVQVRTDHARSAHRLTRFARQYAWTSLRPARMERAALCPAQAGRSILLIMGVELPTGTVTFLFTDMEGSTRNWGKELLPP